MQNSNVIITQLRKLVVPLLGRRSEIPPWAVGARSPPWAVGARSRSVEDLGRRRVQVEVKVWRRTERGLQVEEEESVVFSNIEVRVKHAGPLGLGDLEVTEYIARIRSGQRTAHLSTWQRPKQDSCLTNSSLHCFNVPFTC